MKKLLVLAMSVFMIAALAGCGPSNSGNASAETANQETVQESVQSEVSDTAAETQEDVQTEATTDANGETDTADGSNILVAYFSLAGEQYNVGVIEEGNTAIVAKMIAEKTGADLFEIEPVNEYPSSHSELLTVAQNEQRENARPEIAGTVENMDDYDIVYIGYPNWWGDMPMIVYNFLESYDFDGKTVIPFCTHGGSGLSRTESTIAGICDGATMLDGFAISGETAQNNREKTDSEVTDWLEKIGQ